MPTFQADIPGMVGHALGEGPLHVGESPHSGRTLPVGWCDGRILVLRPSVSVRTCRGRVARMDVTVTIFNPSTGGIADD